MFLEVFLKDTMIYVLLRHLNLIMNRFVLISYGILERRMLNQYNMSPANPIENPISFLPLYLLTNERGGKTIYILAI